MIKKLGFMQGRLVDSEKKNLIQCFPVKNWKLELKIANKIGFKIMEWTIDSDSLQNNPIFNGNLTELKYLLKKYKIKIPSITLDYFMQEPFFKKKKKKNKDKIIDVLKKIISNGNKIGIKYFVFPLVDNSSIKSLDEEKILIKEIKNLSKNLKKNSKILFEIDYKPERITNFLDKFKSKKIGINYDTGNSAGLGYDFNKEISYIKFVKNIHIKDRVFNGNTIRLGKGNWNYKKFFSLIKGRYSGNLILQTARNPKKDHIKEININKRFLENEFK